MFAAWAALTATSVGLIQFFRIEFTKSAPRWRIARGLTPCCL
jgi:hypothetical protein